MVQDVLIEVQDNLASRIALRYACQMERSVPFLMQALHIPDLKEYGGAPGNGWVREKWEDVVVENACGNITEMIKKECLDCYSDRHPMIVSGQRDPVILGELSRQHYGLFIEGQLHSYEPDPFFEKLCSQFYKKLPCPALLVKNLTDPAAGALIIGTSDKIPLNAAAQFPLAGSMPGKLDILICRFEGSTDGAVEIETDEDVFKGLDTSVLKRTDLSGTIRSVQGKPEDLAGTIREYALIVSFVPKCHEPLARLLATYPGTILFYPDQETPL